MGAKLKMPGFFLSPILQLRSARAGQYYFHQDVKVVSKLPPKGFVSIGLLPFQIEQQCPEERDNIRFDLTIKGTYYVTDANYSLPLSD